MENNVKENKALTRQEKAAARANAIAAKRLAKNKTKVRESLGDRILLGFTDFVLVMVLIIVGYPVVYTISCSLSSNAALQTGRVVLWPVDFSFASYEFVFHYKVIWQGFRNSLMFVVVGVSLTMTFSILCAYPMSKRNFQARGLIMTILFIPTMISAGMIPTLLVRSAMGLRNNVWAIFLYGTFGCHGMIIIRTCFQNAVPGELYDAAAIDGASDLQTLVKIALPLSKATLSVQTLYSAVGNWNEYFASMLYLPSRADLWPLQLVLRPILTASQQLSTDGMSATESMALENTGTEGVIYALIVIATVPVLLLFFVVQKYFEKGVMVGSVKG